MSYKAPNSIHVLYKNGDYETHLGVIHHYTNQQNFLCVTTQHHTEHCINLADVRNFTVYYPEI